MKHSVLILLITFLCAGCATHKVGIPTGYSGPTANLTGHLASPVEFFAGNEAHCQICAIDGSKKGPGTTYTLLPGHHQLELYLSNKSEEFYGNLELNLPKPNHYQLRAHREYDRFFITLTDMDQSVVVSTFSCDVNRHLPRFIFMPI